MARRSSKVSLPQHAFKKPQAQVARDFAVSQRAVSGERSKGGLLPAGDVRLTANIDSDLHLALKHRAVDERTTIGELIEAWIRTWPKPK